mmetsp:Transcript_106685/g.283764  ORF Transcript_106685/g.283764 Transcript_106685/m.283764 type:complete len:373 (-) Transcript_106685:1405-2523(-)
MTCAVPPSCTARATWHEDRHAASAWSKRHAPPPNLSGLGCRGSQATKGFGFSTCVSSQRLALLQGAATISPPGASSVFQHSRINVDEGHIGALGLGVREQDAHPILHQGVCPDGLDELVVVAARPSIWISIVQLHPALYQALVKTPDCTETGVLAGSAAPAAWRRRRQVRVRAGREDPALQLPGQARHLLKASRLCSGAPVARVVSAPLCPMLDHAAEVHDAELCTIHCHEVHVGFLRRSCDKVTASCQVGRPPVPLSVHGLPQGEVLRRLPPGWHLKLHDARVHATAEHVLVVWREDAHHIVAAGCQGLDRPITRERLPEVPDLASMVEGRGDEDVRRVVAEAADVDEVLMHAVGTMQHAARLQIVDCNVG